MNRPLVTEQEARSILLKYEMDDTHWKKWRVKFKNFRAHAPQRDLECLLSFRQYVKLAAKAGIETPDEIGKNADKYQMARKGDVGNYEWGNCRFILMSENQNEKTLNGGRERGAAKCRGRTAETHAGVARTVAARLGANKKTHEFAARIALKKSKNFKVKSPTGEVYRGRNLVEFCEEHELSRSSLSKVCRGERSDHRGWTGRYL